MTHKSTYGQFFTKDILWLKPQIISFIKKTKKQSIFDPFVGEGYLLKGVEKVIHITDLKGMDIDESFGYETNDSLVNISSTDRLIVTNPPYLAKNSAKRNNADTYKYFLDNKFEDLYQIALQKCLETHDYVVAIIPETYILTGLFFDRLNSVTILEDNPFSDTDCPVCVTCFGKNKTKDVVVYKNDKKIGMLSEIKKHEKKPIYNYNIVFNVPDGNIGLRGIDGVAKDKQIQFCLPQDLNYDTSKICVSSRSITVLQVECSNVKKVISEANKILSEYRIKTHDVLLASFKNNTKVGTRRRRLDFSAARAILEEAIDNVSKI